ncbi:hypothetical protein GPALN_005049 [Globodera pallida]|nr:hypothetical protein GPALN_005049 [Globodera pallida]
MPNALLSFEHNPRRTSIVLLICTLLLIGGATALGGLRFGARGCQEDCDTLVQKQGFDLNTCMKCCALKRIGDKC